MIESQGIFRVNSHKVKDFTEKKIVQRGLPITNGVFSSHTHKDHAEEINLLNYRGVTCSR